MPASKISIHERVIRNIIARLNTIKKTNGYEVDVLEVVRTSMVPAVAAPAGVLILCPLEKVPDQDRFQSTDRDSFTLTVEVWAWGDMTDSGDDQEWNAYESAISDAMLKPMFDNYHPMPCLAQIGVTFDSANPLYDVGGQNSVGGGVAYYEIKFRHLIGDAYKWDGSDSYATTDDALPDGS